VTCYARACRQAQPCPTDRHCEAVWHACTPPPAELCVDYECGDCHATWKWRLGTDGGTWHRDPLHNLTGVT
jgi:hypothetical protein